MTEKKRWTRSVAGLYVDAITGCYVVNDSGAWYVVTADGWKLIPPFPTMEKAKAWTEVGDKTQGLQIRGVALR